MNVFLLYIDPRHAECVVPSADIPRVSHIGYNSDDPDLYHLYEIETELGFSEVSKHFDKARSIICVCLNGVDIPHRFIDNVTLYDDTHTMKDDDIDISQ